MSYSKEVPTDPAEATSRKRRLRHPLLRRTVTTAVENVDVEVTPDPNEPSQPPKPRFRLRRSADRRDRRPDRRRTRARLPRVPGARRIPQDIGAVEVSDVRVRQPVSFGRYLQRLKLPPASSLPSSSPAVA